jgi:hypothetical protein
VGLRLVFCVTMKAIARSTARSCDVEVRGICSRKLMKTARWFC